MEGTAQPTAPQSGSESSLIEAGARRLAALQTAPPAPNGQQAQPQAPAPTAAYAELDEPPPDSTPSDGTETAAESSDTGTPDQPALPPSDLVLWHDQTTGAPVTVKEAQRGYMREQDYHAKQTLMSQGRDALMTVLQETAARNEAAGRRLEATLPPIDDSLRFTDPATWGAQKIERYEAMQEVARLYAEAQQDRRMMAEHDGQQAEAEMSRAMPWWSDHAVMLREQKLAREYLQAEGYPPAEVERIRSNPWYIRAVVMAARHKPVVQGASKGGAASAAARAQPSPSIAQSQTRPPPAGTAAYRQQQRGGPAVPTRSRGGRAMIDTGASRLKPVPVTRS